MDKARSQGPTRKQDPQPDTGAPMRRTPLAPWESPRAPRFPAQRDGRINSPHSGRRCSAGEQTAERRALRRLELLQRSGPARPRGPHAPAPSLGLPSPACRAPPSPPPSANKKRPGGARAPERRRCAVVRAGGCASARAVPRRYPARMEPWPRRRRRRGSHQLVATFLRDPGSGRVYRRGKLIGKVGRPSRERAVGRGLCTGPCARAWRTRPVGGSAWAPGADARPWSFLRAWACEAAWSQEGPGSRALRAHLAAPGL